MTKENDIPIDHEEPDNDINKKLLEEARRPLTPEERREQRISFAMGMLGKKNTMTRDEVRKLAEEQYG